ncbi:MAG: regulator of (H+)-ATPase in vacuolar membrane [Phylliscum demangeonii]|nr:MAG: regulator of (H+)-ATPase in vacuolar membrane [Phylliscum demangeonii]
MPGTLDVFARDVAISFDGAGTLKSWTAQVDMNRRRVNWLVTSTIETGFAIPSLASGSSIRKAALVDEQKTNLTIWDTREAQLEYEEFFKEAVQDLDWTSTPDNHCVTIILKAGPHGV